MQKLILPALVLSLLSACSHHYHPLDTSKKAKLVSELINNSAECKFFKERLASATMDDDGIDTVYRDAMKARCINEHV